MLCNISRASAHSSRTFCLRTFCLHLSALHKGIAQLSARRVIPPRKLTIFQYLRRHLRPCTPPLHPKLKAVFVFSAPVAPAATPVVPFSLFVFHRLLLQPIPVLILMPRPPHHAAAA